MQEDKSAVIWPIMIYSCHSGLVPGKKKGGGKELFKSLFGSMPLAVRETRIYFALKQDNNECETAPCLSDLAL